MKTNDAPLCANDDETPERALIFLTIKEAATLLKVSEKSIRRLIAQGRIPVARVGRRIRIRQDELLAAIQIRVETEAAQKPQNTQNIAHEILATLSQEKTEP